MDKAQLPELVMKLRNNLDKILVGVSGLMILVGGYLTWDYRSYTNCQVQLLEANRTTTVTFAESLRILLAQPPLPAEERRKAFEQLQEALNHQRVVQQQVGDCK